MADESATNPVAETENPVSETEVANAPAEGEQPEASTEPETPETLEDDTEEVEHEGQKYRVPKALKGALMMQADYTRKTQELAETRRQTEALDKELQERDERLRQQAEAQQANFREVAQLMNLDGQIEQYAKLDWAKLWQEEPQRAGMLNSQWQALQVSRNGLAGQLHQREQQRIAEEQQKAFQKQQETARRMEQANEVLRRDIPNWSPDLRDKLKSFAVTQGGFTAEDLEKITDPRQVKILHLAYLGHQLSQKSRAATKPATPAAKPVPSVTSRSAPAAKSPERMTTEEWMKYRMKQVEARNAANLPFRR